MSQIETKCALQPIGWLVGANQCCNSRLLLLLGLSIINWNKINIYLGCQKPFLEFYIFSKTGRFTHENILLTIQRTIWYIHFIMHTNPKTNQHYRRCANVSLVSRKYIHGTQIGDSTRNVLLLMLVLSVIDKIILVWPRFRFVWLQFWWSSKRLNFNLSNSPYILGVSQRPWISGMKI